MRMSNMDTRYDADTDGDPVQSQTDKQNAYQYIKQLTEHNHFKRKLNKR